MKNAWKCPECGTRVGVSILLCPCGYHRPTGRKLDPDELENGGPLPTAPRSTDVGSGPIWLPRAAWLCRALAWISGAGGIFYAIALAAGGDPTQAQSGAAKTDILIRALVSLVGGAIAFVVHQALAEAIDVLIRIDRRVVGDPPRSETGRR